MTPGRAKRSKPCACCGEPFEYTHDNRKKQYCSVICRRGLYGQTNCLPLASCRGCRTTFIARGQRTTCGNLRCRHLLLYERKSPTPCETCGELITEQRGSPRWCGKACYQQSAEYRRERRRARRRPAERARRRAYHRRRKAKLAGRVLVGESYLPEEIFERDGWRCKLCGAKLDRNVNVPHPKAPTIDHIIPLSEGGDDTRTNVHAAHFICNSRKGQRGGGEQLLLVG